MNNRAKAIALDRRRARERDSVRNEQRAFALRLLSVAGDVSFSRLRQAMKIARTFSPKKQPAPKKPQPGLRMARGGA